MLSLRGVGLLLAAHTVSPEVRRLNVGNGQKLSLLEKKNSAGVVSDTLFLSRSVFRAWSHTRTSDFLCLLV